MRGKFAFVLGAAIGYVLGTRAGRERYEQIKRGAKALWGTEPVQRGVTVVRDAVDEHAGDAISYVRRASAEAFSNYAKRADEKKRDKRKRQPSTQAPSHDDAEPSKKKPATGSSTSAKSTQKGAK